MRVRRLEDRKRRFCFILHDIRFLIETTETKNKSNLIKKCDCHSNTLYDKNSGGTFFV